MAMGFYVTTRHLRIGIDGAQGTGKTTLLGIMAAHFGKTFSYIPEASRVVASRFGVGSSSDWPALLADRHRLEEFFRAEEEWNIALEDASGAFLVDSSLWLIAAFRQLFECESGLNRALGRSYDILLYCAPTADVEADGFRFLTGRDEVDRNYRDLVSRFPGQFEKLPSGQARGRTAISLIERRLESVPRAERTNLRG